MVRTTICLGTILVAILLVALSVNGCSRAADRTLTIYQFQTIDDTYAGQFEIDASQLPSDAIESQEDSGGQGAPVTKLTIKDRYSIRVVLVPVNTKQGAGTGSSE